MFENEIGPGMLQFKVGQTRVLKEYVRYKPPATNCVDSCPCCVKFSQIVPGVSKKYTKLPGDLTTVI